MTATSTSMREHCPNRVYQAQGSAGCLPTTGTIGCRNVRSGQGRAEQTLWIQISCEGELPIQKRRFGRYTLSQMGEGHTNSDVSNNSIMLHFWPLVKSHQRRTETNTEEPRSLKHSLKEDTATFYWKIANPRWARSFTECCVLASVINNMFSPFAPPRPLLLTILLIKIAN